MSVEALAKVFLTPANLVLFDVSWAPGAKERKAAWVARFSAERTLVRSVDCFRSREEAEKAEVSKYPTVALVSEDGRVTRCLSTQDSPKLLRWSAEALDDLKRYTRRD